MADPDLDFDATTERTLRLRTSAKWRAYPDDVLPAMRHAGISETDITTMMVDNPRRILEGCVPY